NDLLIHPHYGDAVDAAGRGADQQARRDSARRHRTFSRWQACARTHLLGSSIGAEANRIVDRSGLADLGRGNGTKSARTRPLTNSVFRYAMGFGTSGHMMMRALVYLISIALLSVI